MGIEKPINNANNEDRSESDKKAPQNGIFLLDMEVR